ncbi:hypothetical protein [Microbacterium sp. 2FI]|uniref:hypothetical protein n=1 Tax=Microbacterium sp. 2FI TaxID=2502193 RepID=UPI0010F9A87A|nr:hypothetical protein [Microbacterium sp. 2FI]
MKPSPEVEADAESDAALDTVTTARRQRWFTAPSTIIAFAAGALVAGGVIAVALGFENTPPDATLVPAGVEPDDRLITLLSGEGSDYEELSPPPGFASEQLIDLSTLRGFGTYRDIEVWSAENAHGSRCLIAVHRQTVDVIARECIPAGTDVVMDTRQHGLAAGERLRFVLRDANADALHVYHLTPEEAR